MLPYLTVDGLREDWSVSEVSKYSVYFYAHTTLYDTDVTIPTAFHVQIDWQPC